jgi:hypothetical protein
LSSWTPSKMRGMDLVAAAGLAPVAPPAGWFDDPGLTGPTPMTVTDDGRVYGHVACWDSCHEGFVGTCVRPPRSRNGYAKFHVGVIRTKEGRDLPIGKLTIDRSQEGGHASLRATEAQARAHYDNVTATAAYVRCGEDQHGIWMAGVLRNGVSGELLRDLRANPPSGDWRNGEMIAVHCVNTPGFAVLRASVRPLERNPVVALVAGLGEPMRMESDLTDREADVRARVLAARAEGIDALAELAEA